MIGCLAQTAYFVEELPVEFIELSVAKLVKSSLKVLHHLVVVLAW